MTKRHETQSQWNKYRRRQWLQVKFVMIPMGPTWGQQKPTHWVHPISSVNEGIFLINAYMSPWPLTEFQIQTQNDYKIETVCFHIVSFIEKHRLLSSGSIPVHTYIRRIFTPKAYRMMLLCCQQASQYMAYLHALLRNRKRYTHTLDKINRSMETVSGILLAWWPEEALSCMMPSASCGLKVTLVQPGDLSALQHTPPPSSSCSVCLPGLSLKLECKVFGVEIVSSQIFAQ